jgi:hypothetical protein
MTLLLSMHIGPTASALICAVLMLVGNIHQRAPRLLSGGSAEQSPICSPSYLGAIFWLLSILTGIAFLAEGAVLDWGPPAADLQKSQHCRGRRCGMHVICSDCDDLQTVRSCSQQQGR